MATSLFYILVFPGILFLGLFSLALEFFDRKFHARMQNRKGPPWFQPLADFIKLSAKEGIIPEEANATLFRLMPLLALTAATVSFFYIPLWSTRALYSFDGDLIVVIYLLTIPTLALFLAGWVSASLYSMLGAVRALTQLFAYEVPLFMAVLSPAILAGSWSLSEIAAFFNDKPLFIIFNVPGFLISLIALLGKLEKVPFDIPEAETEIVGGSFTEYSGRYLAFFRMAVDIEMLVGASLVAALFLPIGLDLHPVAGFIVYILKVLFVVALLSVLRTIFARIRIDQMIRFCWIYLAPLSLIQILIAFIVKGLFLQ